MSSLPEARWMQQALSLAARAQGRTAPNPMVGAVVVNNGVRVGAGYHHGPGTPHAEIHALEQAGSAAKGADLYVTLEPCCHTNKRTPPCVPAVISAGIKRVIVAMADPNPPVDGGGIEALQAAGIEVVVGMKAAAVRRLSAPYIHAMTRGLPWLTLKIAQTLDGKVATASGESQWITGEQARSHGHLLRQRHDAILVGSGTLLADNPQLTCRRRGGRNPLRVVVDSSLRTPIDARVLTAAPPPPTIVVGAAADGAVAERLRAAGAEVWMLPGAAGRVDLTALLKGLLARGVHSVLCEGGPTLAAALLSAGLVNRVACYLAPALMGGADARGALGGSSPQTLTGMRRLGPFTTRRLGNDLLMEADVLPPERLPLKKD